MHCTTHPMVDVGQDVVKKPICSMLNSFYDTTMVIVLHNPVRQSTLPAIRRARRRVQSPTDDDDDDDDEDYYRRIKAPHSSVVQSKLPSAFQTVSIQYDHSEEQRQMCYVKIGKLIIT